MDRPAAKSFSQARFLVSAASPGQFPPDQGAEIAFAGRSNSGKSSAINTLTGRQGLARISKTPGRTRLINFFELQSGARFVDLPGYGYAEVSNTERASWLPMLEALRGRTSLRGLCLIVDSRRGIQAEDSELIAWADPALRQVHVLLTKADKLKKNEARVQVDKARRLLGNAATVQLFSSQDGGGLVEARKRVAAMLAEKKTPATLRPPGSDTSGTGLD
jgi:GTP-binding protein